MVDVGATHALYVAFSPMFYHIFEIMFLLAIVVVLGKLVREWFILEHVERKKKE